MCDAVNIMKKSLLTSGKKKLHDDDNFIGGGILGESSSS